MLIVDCSVTLAMIFVDEGGEYARRVAQYLLDKEAMVPSHWHFETANGLLNATRRNRLSEGMRSSALDHLRGFNAKVDGMSFKHAHYRTLELAEQYKLTIYDAAYLELALRTGLKLATLDQELVAAATSENLYFE